MIELIKAIIFGIVEGITEWLPISSTGHMILLDEIMPLNVTADFLEMFLVVIQLGAILAVVVIYWKRLFPFGVEKVQGRTKLTVDQPMMIMWLKILIASVPAAIVGIFLDDWLNALFYNYMTVAIMLILFGVLFIVIENSRFSKNARVNAISDITYTAALIIGVFQMIAAVFPGTSRSGATIVGALLIGISRTVAAEFTFFLAIPAMLGGSALKLLKFGFHFTSQELMILIVGMAVAFIVSILAIKFLMAYIKKHDFKAFGWYRIILGVIILIYFAVQTF
ncbi:MAG TPA: undecaprenyl-diphosphate phosphatase [Candidatus Scybalocola faecigallinarum]|uniref:Undecaprenyl-diphosphatase n=1 Tax=Candidatus Scybalocola faecigallinarum TaxID=2840941 RepID=A0A9D1JQP1_9FIRM|nr:undecaprenyl-diphosphate phosphatase [Candidatus Scybalocola faecigallinarum]